LPTYEQNIDILQPSLSQIARTSDSVIIQIDGQTLVNDSYKVYTTSNDCFKVKRIIKRNAYGIENKREYTILTNVEKT
jgi:RNA:NAD 2'-phosphotransferase (TPT1/KptA family)